MRNRVLIDGCKWLLDGFEFDSDEALDVYVQDKIKSGEYNIEDGKLVITQSVDLQQKAIDIIDSIQKEVKGVAKLVTPKLTEEQKKSKKYVSKLLNDGFVYEDAEEAESYYIIDGSVGVNNFLRIYTPEGREHALVKAFDEKSWKEYKFKKLRDDPKNTGVSDAQINQWLDEEMETWPQLSEIGTDIHSIAENIFNGTPIERGPGSHLSEELFNDVKKQFVALREEILKQYPGAKIYTELGIYSKDLSANVLAQLPEGKDSINGKIDLLVVDKDGVAHLYDFKVSRHDVGGWFDGQYLNDKDFKGEVARRKSDKLWDIGKIKAASYQLAMYAEMLRQKGIEVYDANIIPIKLNLEYNDSERETGVKRVKSVKINKTETNLPGVIFGKYAQDMKMAMKQTPVADDETVLKWADIFNQFFPKNSTLLQREEKRANVDYYLNNSVYTTALRPGQEPSWNKEAKFRFKNIGAVGMRPYSYFKTKEELEEHIKNYIDNLHSSASEFSKSLGRTINLILSGKEPAEKIGEVIKDASWAINRFKRYFTEPGWSLDSTEQLLNNGIFVFTSGTTSEIIVLENQDLAPIQNLGMGTSLLGKNTQDKYVNRSRTLDASNGNLALMKAMIFIANNQDLFKNKRISEISVMNPDAGKEISHLPSRLIDNYNDLCRKNPNVDTPLLMRDIFFSDVESCIRGASSRLKTIETSVTGITKLDTEAKSLEDIENMIAELKLKYPQLRTNRNFDKSALDSDPAWQAYWYLEQARLSLTHEYITSETQSGKWINKGFRLNGYMIASPQFSSSADLRQLGALLQNYENDVARAIFKQGMKMQQLFEKLYDADGNGTQAFREWFVRNSDGSLNERLLLKDPDSADFKGSPASREALREFLRTVAELKRPNLTESDIEQMKESGEYYEVPLTEAVWSRQLKGNIGQEGIVKGVIKTIRNKWKEAATLTKNVFAEDEVSALETNKSGDRLYNKFDITGQARAEKIRDTGVGRYETNMEIVFNQVLVAYNRVRIAEDYIPRIQAMKLGLMYAKDHGGVENTRIQEAFDKIIKSKFYGESIIEDTNLQAVYKWLSFVRSIFTTMTLSVNVPSFLRESLQGIYTGVSRSFVEVLPGVDKATYAKGLAHVIQESHKNFSSTSLLQQLNAQYQMANQSVNQIANQRRLRWGNIRNWSKDTLFLTATAPDFMHRVSILVAKMMGDGCWEAHSLNENGELVYDFKKDKRFEQLLANNTSHPDYLKQKSLYERMIEEFNKDGYRNPDGTELNADNLDALPRAYTNTENRAIKNYADLLYGHYDDASRALVTDTLIGSFMLQYKTYLTAKFEQWTMPQGIYNTEMLKQQFDPVTGEELYMKISYDETGRPQRDIVRKSQVTQQEIDNGEVRVYYDYEGIPMEGLFQESLHFVKSLAKMDFKEFKKLWDNPTDRGFFLLALHDQVFMALLMMLATFIFGSANDVEHPWNIAEVSKEMRKKGPLSQLAWNVIEGSTVDAQFFGLAGGNSGVVQSMAANPALFTAAQRFAVSNWNMITGKQSFAYTASQNIGAIRTFQGTIKQLDEANND